uniref:mitogen-activated protein kinase kinase n=1 Tax=Acrobeloides nanus TaxID=290746 RepID=A0A914DES5_9BILA
MAVLKSLVACKSKNIIYRDVKPDNVLVSRDGAIKLCDFGESRILNDSMASTFAGELSYWPPERFIHEKTKFDVRADIWSLGITLIELVTGSVPYKDKKGNIPNNIILLQNLIVNLDTNKTVEDALKGYNEETKDFVKSCLKKIEERPKYDNLMDTQFYKRCEKMDYIKQEWDENLKTKELTEFTDKELYDNVLNYFLKIKNCIFSSQFTSHPDLDQVIISGKRAALVTSELNQVGTSRTFIFYTTFMNNNNIPNTYQTDVHVSEKDEVYIKSFFQDYRDLEKIQLQKS